MSMRARSCAGQKLKSRSARRGAASADAPSVKPRAMLEFTNEQLSRISLLAFTFQNAAFVLLMRGCDAGVAAWQVGHACVILDAGILGVDGRCEQPPGARGGGFRQARARLQGADADLGCAAQVEQEEEVVED